MREISTHWCIRKTREEQSAANTDWNHETCQELPGGSPLTSIREGGEFRLSASGFACFCHSLCRNPRSRIFRKPESGSRKPTLTLPPKPAQPASAAEEQRGARASGSPP